MSSSVLKVDFLRGTVPLGGFRSLRVVSTSARDVVRCFRVVNVVKLQMRVGSAQRQHAITSTICPGYDSCSGVSHFLVVRRLLAWCPRFSV